MQLNTSKYTEDCFNNWDGTLEVVQMMLEIAEKFSSEEEVIQAISEYQNGRLDITEYID